jgi:hypothetical protein
MLDPEVAQRLGAQPHGTAPPKPAEHPSVVTKCRQKSIERSCSVPAAGLGQAPRSLMTANTTGVRW